MYNIWSRVNPTILCHKIWRVSESSWDSDTKERIEIIEPNQFIQCAFLQMNEGKTFKPHQHIWKCGPERIIAQESWVIIRGLVEVSFYDIDGTLLEKQILKEHDASFTLQGGHTYEILEDNTIVYEYKTGPYTGQENDKKFLDE